MSETFEAAFLKWTGGKSQKEARIAIFDHVRDIPYAVLPELNTPAHYVNMLTIKRGSCMPKHLLLGAMFQRMGLPVLYAVYQYRWDEFEHLYPPHLQKLSREMPAGNHLACMVEIDEKMVLVDATLDLPLSVLGLPVNRDWDGVSNTLLPVVPCGDEQIYHPCEAVLTLEPQITDAMKSFYRALNAWLDTVRLGSRES